MIKYLKPMVLLCATHFLITDQIFASKAVFSVLEQTTQNRIITGIIVDIDNMPLSNVTLTESGTSNATSTDSNGFFRLNLSVNATSLHVSKLNYEEQRFVIDTRTAYEITLVKKEKSIDEVVVVGFGTQKKVNLTGAVSTISSKEFHVDMDTWTDTWIKYEIVK